ncbi:MAG: hypothetical protein IBJ00_07895, partial [Alphaproteobacteria bacterium]|nr:hypothetical protein [Alphaproteobacteria bacterium]
MLVNIHILIALVITLFYEISEAQAVGNMLDLNGDGKLSEVDLPFTYYPRSSSPPKFTVVSQGAYAEYTRDETQPSTWIIGPLDPCIGIMIGNLRGCLAFHFHWSNDLEDMGKKINMHFSKDKDSLFARIFTVKNDRDWKKRKDSFAYGVKTHKEVVIKIKDYLVSSGILRERITAQMYTPPEPTGNLG